MIKQLAKRIILSQGWLIKRTVQNESFVTKFPFILVNKSRYMEKLSENDPASESLGVFQRIDMGQLWHHHY